MSADPDVPVVQLIGSEFHSLFCGSESRIDAIKWISEMLQVAASPVEGNGEAMSRSPGRETFLRTLRLNRRRRMKSLLTGCRQLRKAPLRALR